jgi:transformation/transcription domain-associated protein
VFNKSMEHASTVQTRLHAIFGEQEWDAMAKSYWIRQALDLLLSVVESGAAQRAARRRLRAAAAAAAPRRRLPQVALRDDDAEPFRNFVQQQSTFLAALPQLSLLDDMLSPLKDLLHQDVTLASYLWQLLFPQLWHQLTTSERRVLGDEISSVLQKDYQLQSRQPPNVACTLLDGLSRCAVPPPVKPELLRFVGRTFGAWHISLAMLERQLAPYCGAPATGALSAAAPARDERSEHAFDAALDLLLPLGERDLWYGLWQRRAAMPATRAALRLQQHKRWAHAQAQYFEVMEAELTGADEAARSVSTSESALWQNEWIEAAKRLGQWELLTEFAKQNDMTDLLVDAAWHVPDWATFKDGVRRKLAVTNDDPDAKIAQGYLLIYEQKTSEVEAVYAQAAIAALQRWKAMPFVSLRAKTSLLNTFQALVELKESARLARDLVGKNRDSIAMEVKARLGAWRERLPNEWEDMRSWSDLIVWRQFVYSLAMTAYSPSAERPYPPGVAYMGHHETAWSIYTLARVARRQGLVDISLTMLDRLLQLPQLETPVAFNKLREHALCHFQLPPSQYRGALQVLEQAQLNFFTPEMRAELSQLRGVFLSRLADDNVPPTDANAAFASAVAICPDLAQGWISWGAFCDAQLRVHGHRAYAQYSMACHLEACRADAQRSFDALPHALWLLTFKGEPPSGAPPSSAADADGELTRMLAAFERHSLALPSWIWLAWLPQLVAGSARARARSFTACSSASRSSTRRCSCLRCASTRCCSASATAARSPARATAASASATPPCRRIAT